MAEPIDADNNAYWTPNANNSNRTNAFSVLAQDMFNAVSSSPVEVPVYVYENPTLTEFNKNVDGTAEDTEVELFFCELISASDANDDGWVKWIMPTTPMIRKHCNRWLAKKTKNPCKYSTTRRAKRTPIIRDICAGRA